jgi:hypothetical protein
MKRPSRDTLFIVGAIILLAASLLFSLWFYMEGYPNYIRGR